MISRFLRQARTKLLEAIQSSTEPCPQAFSFVIGNEACDLDSAMSAIMYAWFLTQVHTGPTQAYYFPVLNILESRFRLKTETSFLLDKYGVTQSDIIFRDTVDLHQFFSSNRTNHHITLVDHHVLPRSDEYMYPFVSEVIDHRPQVKTIDPGVDVEIATVGSCVTLIAERIIRAIDDEKLNLNEDEKKETATLISGSILLDTANLLPAAGKVTDRDITVIKKFWGDVNNPELHRLYQELSEAKFSARGLTAKDLMLKDAKFIENSDCTIKVMFSTIHDKLDNFIQREDAPNCIPELVQLENCILWVSLAPVEKDECGKPFKPILLYSEDSRLSEKITQVLTEADKPCLELTRRGVNGLGNNYSLFRMYNIKASRKQLLPIVQAAI